MEVDDLPGTLHPEAHNAANCNQIQIFYQVEDVKSQGVGSGAGEQIVKWRDSVDIKEAPEKEQEKKVRKHSIGPGAGCMRAGKVCRCRHERYYVQKQHRISDRIVGHLSVENKFVKDKNRLVQRPKAIGGCKKHPERAAPQGVLHPIAHGDAGREEQEKKIANTAVSQKRRARRCSDGNRGSDDQNGSKSRGPVKRSQPNWQIGQRPFRHNSRNSLPH